METSPFIRLHEGAIQNTLEFQVARLGSARSAAPPSCDRSRAFIRYHVYAYFLSDSDYGEEELFRGLDLMSDPVSVVQQGIQVVTYSATPRTRVRVLSYPGRGVVYSVLAISERSSAAYVPVASYNCDLSSSIVGCGKMNGVVAVILFSSLSVAGLVITFRGHQWFAFQVYWSSFLCSLLTFLVLLPKYTLLLATQRELVSLAASFAVALVWLSLWRCFKKPLISVLTSGLLLGFLVIASVLFSTLGNEQLFRSELNYWLIVGAGSLAIPVVLLPFGVLLSILACSVVGSYTVVFAVDRFVGGSLSFIVINVLKRAAFKEVLFAANQVPFQTKDVVLASCWLILALLGLVTQLYMATRAPPRRRRRGSRSNSVRLSRRLRRRSSHRRSSSRSRSVSRLRRSSRSHNPRPTAPPTEPAIESQPLISEAAPVVYSAI